MRETKFYNPTTLTEALDVLAQNPAATIVNGGTDIVEAIAEHRVEPDCVLYLQNIAELSGVRADAGEVVIGGACTYETMLASDLCREFDGLIQAVSTVGSPPIRVTGTPAGNIMTAAPAADCTTMLLALGANVVAAGKDGETTIPLCDFLLSRGKTQLQPGQLIKEIRFPRVKSRSAYTKLARRKGQDIGKILIGCAIELDEAGVCTQARFGLGAVSSVPVRAYSTESLVKGKRPADVVETLRASFPDEAPLRPSRFKTYKEQVLGVIIVRTFKAACGLD